jgi:hypothetical protein
MKVLARLDLRHQELAFQAFEAFKEYLPLDCVFNLKMLAFESALLTREQLPAQSVS